MFTTTGTKATWANPTPTPDSQKQNGGWYYNPATGSVDRWFTNGSAPSGGTSSSGGNGTGVSNQDLDSIFNPAFDSLNAQEDNLKNVDFPAAQAQIDQSTNELKSNLDTNKQQADQEFATQSSDLSSEKQSAFDQALQSYKQLQQKAGALYGGQSSAGGAANDILNQTYLQQQGGIEQNYAKTQRDLVNHQATVTQFVVSEKARLDQEHELQIKQANQQLKDALLQVEMSRNMLNSQKEAAKVDLVKQTVAQMQQYDAAKFTAQLNLDTWKKQQQYLIDNGLAQANSGAVDVTTNNPFNQQASAFDQYSTQGTGQPTYVDTITPQILNAGNRRDDLASTNPFGYLG